MHDRAGAKIKLSADFYLAEQVRQKNAPRHNALMRLRLIKRK
tara:strand:+ start:51 stop:176 length:126 start_codon:yes stop_codon:yes gene_type:complete